MVTSLQAWRTGRLASACRSVLTGLATGYCITRFLAEPIMLQGPSMEPTLQNNDWIIANKYTAIFHKNDYKVGDIVIARSPMSPNSFICKRIAALPGDQVRMGMLGLFSRTVPAGHVWLLGDNAQDSTDSRDLGPIPIGLIIGTVAYRFWPLDRVTKFEAQSRDCTCVDARA